MNVNTIKKTMFLGLFWLFSGNLTLQADNRIILYLKNAPENIIQDAEVEAAKTGLAAKITELESKIPSSISKNMIKNSLRSLIKPSLGGIIAIYGGYMDISSPNGLITFPLKHVTQKIYIAITETINLINIKGATYSHREYPSNDPAQVQLFSFQMNQDAKKNWYWEVKTEQIPADKKINPLTMVLLTSPKNIVVPLGQFFATENVQIILPSIYVVNRSSTEEAVLNSLDIRRYFEPISLEQKKVTDMSVQKMITNV